ncbi:MAG: hypothetical protein C5B48_09185 [Candidatus Rokuibacteriota bacterium]|nr:MAG: hypothetical protein C5B48_09185 [Candidatus Rokubacteria bacterium]
MSANGRFVAFESLTTTLTEVIRGIFVHDLRTGTTVGASLGLTGNHFPNGDSFNPTISASGRFVAFESLASNLVAADSNAKRDIFVRDLRTGKTVRASVDSVRNQANGDSRNPAISANGRFVAFESDATNLVGGDGNGRRDIFVHDLRIGRTVRASVDSAGNQANGDSFSPAISGNGRFVAFSSSATNLVGGDTNGSSDIFVHDLKTGETVRASVDSVGNQADGSSVGLAISANGRVVAFLSDATNLVDTDTNGLLDVFVHDLRTGKTVRASVDSAGNQANGEPFFRPVLSANGRFVAFDSSASNLVAGDTNSVIDTFVHDLRTGKTVRVSVNGLGDQADGKSLFPAISANGRVVVFASDATNLVAGDTNGVRDIFVHK